MNLYITTTGSDSNPGTETSPFATLTGARDAVRRVIENGLCEPITVHIGAGEYRMDSIRFDERDSGTEDCPITYIADGEVILHGGISVAREDWQMPDAAMLSRFAEEARPHIRMISLTSLGLTAEDWGE